MFQSILFLGYKLNGCFVLQLVESMCWQNHFTQGFLLISVRLHSGVGAVARLWLYAARSRSGWGLTKAMFVSWFTGDVSAA